MGVSSDSVLSSRKRVNRYALPTSGSVPALTVYLAPTSTSGKQVIEGIIYSDASGKPEALLGVSEQMTFTSGTSAGRYDLPFPAPIKISAGNHWIGVLTGASSHVAGFRFDRVSGSRDYNANPYGSGASNPFGAFATDGEQMSLYAAYTTAALRTAAPTVSGVSPASGPEAGGTSVDHGYELRQCPGGQVRRRKRARLTVNSTTSITAISPPGAATVDVTVTNPDGASAVVAGDHYRYTSPSPVPPPPPPPPSGTAGEVRFVKTANSAFDGEAIEANGAWIREHFARMVTWSPFFDSRTSWYPNAWRYQDAYAIYVGSELAREHAEWILRSASGDPLYIPYGHPPVQFAGDISNPAFRQFWIDRTKATVARGYRGVFVDDVDMWATWGASAAKGRRPSAASPARRSAIKAGANTSPPPWQNYAPRSPALKSSTTRCGTPAPYLETAARPTRSCAARWKPPLP